MWENNYWMISRYTSKNILLEFAISTSRPAAARLILQIPAKYFTMYTLKSFNNCIMFNGVEITPSPNRYSISKARIEGCFMPNDRVRQEQEKSSCKCFQYCYRTENPRWQTEMTNKIEHYIYRAANDLEKIHMLINPRLWWMTHIHGVYIYTLYN